MLEQIKLMEVRHRKTSSVENGIKLKVSKIYEFDRTCTLEINRLLRFTQQESYDGGPKSLEIMVYKLKTNEKKLILQNKTQIRQK